MPASASLSMRAWPFNKPVRDTLEAAFDNFVNLANRVAPGMHIGSGIICCSTTTCRSKGLPKKFRSPSLWPVLCGVQIVRDARAGDSGHLAHVGSMDGIRGLEDIMRVAKNAGAKRVILPLSAIAGLQSVSSEIISGLEPGVLHGW